jgi:hypothetical protein
LRIGVAGWRGPLVRRISWRLQGVHVVWHRRFIQW